MLAWEYEKVNTYLKIAGPLPVCSRLAPWKRGHIEPQTAIRFELVRPSVGLTGWAHPRALKTFAAEQ